jgi:hypothetical protein
MATPIAAFAPVVRPEPLDGRLSGCGVIVGAGEVDPGVTSLVVVADKEVGEAVDGGSLVWTEVGPRVVMMLVTVTGATVSPSLVGLGVITEVMTCVEGGLVDVATVLVVGGGGDELSAIVSTAGNHVQSSLPLSARV